MKQRTNLRDIKVLGENEKIIEIDTRTEQEKLIANMKKDLPVTIELSKALSEIAWSQYTELTKQGFTEEQAMKIMLTHPAWK